MEITITSTVAGTAYLQYLPQPTNTRWSHTPRGNNTGDAILAAQKLGAQTALMDKTWGAPSISVPGEDENRVVFMERNFPHSMEYFYLPLRSLMSFADGQIKYDDLIALVDQLNKA